MEGWTVKYKIGIFGSAKGEFEKILPTLTLLGEELGKHDVILITGATTGVTHHVVSSAHKNGAELWGFSAAQDLESHNNLAHDLDSTIYSKLFYIPKDYPFAKDVNVCRKYRNVTSTASCDAGIIISGRWGTLNEFTNLYDMGKIIGVLTGTGGIADELGNLMKKISKPSKAKVVFNNGPTKLVEKVLEALCA